MVAHGARTQAFNDTTGSGEGSAGSYMTSPANPQTLDWQIHNVAGSTVDWAMASVVVKDGGGGGGGGSYVMFDNDNKYANLATLTGGFQ